MSTSTETVQCTSCFAHAVLPAGKFCRHCGVKLPAKTESSVKVKVEETEQYKTALEAARKQLDQQLKTRAPVEDLKKEIAALKEQVAVERSQAATARALLATHNSYKGVYGHAIGAGSPQNLAQVHGRSQSQSDVDGGGGKAIRSAEGGFSYSTFVPHSRLLPGQIPPTVKEEKKDKDKNKEKDKDKDNDKIPARKRSWSFSELEVEADPAGGRSRANSVQMFVVQGAEVKLLPKGLHVPSPRASPGLRKSASAFLASSLTNSNPPNSPPASSSSSSSSSSSFASASLSSSSGLLSPTRPTVSDGRLSVLDIASNFEQRSHANSASPSPSSSPPSTSPSSSALAASSLSPPSFSAPSLSPPLPSPQPSSLPSSPGEGDNDGDHNRVSGVNGVSGVSGVSGVILRKASRKESPKTLSPMPIPPFLPLTLGSPRRDPPIVFDDINEYRLLVSQLEAELVDARDKCVALDIQCRVKDKTIEELLDRVPRSQSGSGASSSIHITSSAPPTVQHSSVSLVRGSSEEFEGESLAANPDANKSKDKENPGSKASDDVDPRTNYSATAGGTGGISYTRKKKPLLLGKLTTEASGASTKKVTALETEVAALRALVTAKEAEETKLRQQLGDLTQRLASAHAQLTKKVEHWIFEKSDLALMEQR